MVTVMLQTTSKLVYGMEVIVMLQAHLLSVLVIILIGSYVYYSDKFDIR